MRDVRAIVTERGAGCDGRLLRQRGANRADETRQRTAKSCGPGAATLASIRAAPWQRGNGDNKGRSPGRSRISRKTIARGRPGCPGCTCQIRVRSFYPFAHGAAGAAGARPSLRPLSQREQRDRKTRAKARRGNDFGCLKTESANSLSSRTSERSERDTGPITTGSGFAKAGAPAFSNNMTLWLWARPSPGRQRL